MKRHVYFIYFLSILSFAQPCDLGYELNGLNDRITIPNTTYINSNNTAVANRTIETWFKVDDASSRQIIYEEGAQVNAIMFYVEGDRFYCGGFRSNGSTSEFFRSASGDILDDTWYHVAFVMSTSGGTTTFLWYLDGVLQDSQTAFTVPKHTGNISLGRNGGNMRYPNCGTWSASSVTGSSTEHCTNTMTSGSTTKYYFDGNIWGFRIWNSVRTSTEINDNINSELSSGTNLVAYLDDDDVEYLNNSGNWTTASANGNGTTYTWSSTASSTTWATASNWNGNNVPSTAKLQRVVIPSSTNYPSISSEIRIGKLDLSSSSSEITIEDGGTLNVYYDAVNSGTITVENNGSFILQDNEVVTGSGSFIIERDSPNYSLTNMFSIWSTPVAETDSEIDDIFTDTVITYEFDASQNPAAYVQVPRTDYMEVGKGYFIRPTTQNGVQTRTFTGSVNNGCIDETIYYNSATDNFNLIGNPYSSALDWLKFQADNSDIINGTMYYWSQSIVGVNNSTSDFISFNSTGSSEPGTTGNIATGLGVFVKSSQAGTVTFRNTHRVVGSNNQFFKANSNLDDGKSWFRLSGSMGYSPILIGFVPGATDDYESNYDAEFVNEGAAIEFYSFIGTNKYEIQGRTELQPEQQIQVPLGYQVTTAGDYTFSMILEYIDTNFEILLEDTLENTMTDLRVSDYMFIVSEPTEDNNRFILHYNYDETLSTDEFVDESSSGINSFFLNDELITNVEKDLSSPISIQLFDITGKEILNINYENRIQLRNLSSGIYIVNYMFGNSKTVSKKVIKQ